MIRRRAAIALLLPIAMSLAGCGGGDDDGGGAAATATATVVAATATATATGTSTPTSTVTPTATSTATATSTPTSTPTTGPAVAAYAAQECASAKQAAAAAYCEATLGAWALWETSADAGARDAAIAAASSALGSAWSAAEQAALAEGVNCSDQALSAAGAAAIVDPLVEGIVDDVNEGIDLNDDTEAHCGWALLAATAQRCEAVLSAESRHLRNLAGDFDESILNAEKAAAESAFAADWSDTIDAGCPTTATEGAIGQSADALAAQLVLNTIVAPGVSSEEATTISPTGTTEYLGKAITPICMNGSPYHFFVRRGSVNKLVMYYQGGGACWEGLTCSVPVCDTNVDPNGGDNPNNASSGFADRNNPANPFRDWNAVFVAYCGCDIHYGDSAQDYPIGEGSIHVEHRGFHNAQIAEKWAREHFINPEVVFVTGSSAGAYGAWFNAVPLQRAWPASDFHVLADAGNGVITQEFLDGPFANWNFEANLPTDIPGIREALENGTRIPGYTKAVAEYFPRTNWAHYSTAYDGGTGGQTGFYNIMLNDNNPIAGLTWWDASCAFNSVMRDQVIATAAELPSNYRYYIGTGSRHTMWGNNKVYADTTGGVPPIVDWVNAMLTSQSDAPNPQWTNVECENCGLTLSGDPKPSPLEPPFAQVGDNVVIQCPPED